MPHVMSDPSPECLLIYDGRCRLCVAVKNRFDHPIPHKAETALRMITYQSEEAKRVLGASYRPGRPEVAYFIAPGGQIREGLEAFLPLLPRFKGGTALQRLISLPIVRPLARAAYHILARYRYRLFGTVSSVK